jgi:tetratricopeptide (TPR) repeat protein
LVFAAMIVVEPGLNQIRESLRSQRSNNRAPDFSHWIENPEKPAFVRNHVRLYVARWMAQNQFYDEALAHFRQLDDSSVLDPVTLLFYRGLMEHQLLQRDECVKTIERLLEQEENLPRRFGVLSKMMIADIRPLEPDSLDEISRLMNDIRRRTELHRSGQNVRKREQEVIEKLDKLIESLESQQAQQQPGGNAPSNPMEDSFNAGGGADGNVTRKKQIDGGNWGNLPPAQRAAALAEIAKDLPPHYRSVIEEYFRQLANENNPVK